MDILIDFVFWWGYNREENDVWSRSIVGYDVLLCRDFGGLENAGYVRDIEHDGI